MMLVSRCLSRLSLVPCALLVLTSRCRRGRYPSAPPAPCASHQRGKRHLGRHREDSDGGADCSRVESTRAAPARPHSGNLPRLQIVVEEEALTANDTPPVMIGVWQRRVQAARKSPSRDCGSRRWSEQVLGRDGAAEWPEWRRCDRHLCA